MKTIEQVVEYLQRRIEHINNMIEKADGNISNIVVFMDGCKIVATELDDVLSFIKEEKEN